MHPPTTIYVSVCPRCDTIFTVRTKIMTYGICTVCPNYPLSDSITQVHRYQLAPKVSRNAKKSRKAPP
jgi:hypothetical protein